MSIRASLVGTLFGGFIVFCMVMAAQFVFAEDATVTWNAPTHNTDGTVLTDLGGYKLYHGTEPGVYTDVDDLGMIQGEVVSVIYPLEGDATHYFAATAYDTSDNESDLSNEGQKKSVTISESLTITVY